MMTGHGYSMMGLGWGMGLAGILTTAILVLCVAALIKFVFFR